MASFWPEISFLLIFSARDDLVKVSWKSDAGKCRNQQTPPYFDQLSERYQPLCLIQLGKSLSVMSSAHSSFKYSNIALFFYFFTSTTSISYLSHYHWYLDLDKSRNYSSAGQSPMMSSAPSSLEIPTSLSWGILLWETYSELFLLNFGWWSWKSLSYLLKQDRFSVLCYCQKKVLNTLLWTNSD